MFGQRSRQLFALTAAGAFLAVVCMTPTASAKAKPMSTSVTVIGNAKAGKPLFVTTCGTCHTLKAAGTGGTIGPNLDSLAPLTEKTIITQIDNGGAALFTKTFGAARAAKYPTPMPSVYKSEFTTAQIDDIAAYVYTSLAADKKK